VLVPAKYDDGGFSGGTIERPALAQMMADIEDGLIDCVVVYKVDRLSRSLMDFATIVAKFEQHRVSFVSVTQQFNTTTSMGRLTLNILLSFAQFEREIIAERIRDKMAASKKRGKWVGGIPVLGYDISPQGRRLIVNEEEAVQVRQIFKLYLEHGSIGELSAHLANQGWSNKQWTTRHGKEVGGQEFNKTTLHKLLRNKTYIGKVAYKGEVYEGEHAAIVDLATFTTVQEQLDRQNKPKSTSRQKYPALLKGLEVISKGRSTI
jgi:site-specific DNA recombinase